MSIRKLLGNLIGGILVTSLNVFNRFDTRRHILSIYMHDPEKEVFESTVGYLLKKGYRFVSTSELYDFLAQRRELTGKVAVVTLDDAWRNNLQNVVPFAERCNVPITIFTPIQPMEEGVLWLKWFRDKDLQAQFPEIAQQDPKILSTSQRNILWSQLKAAKQYEREIMTVEEVKTLAKHPLVTIGGHTYTHPILPNCTAEEMDFELVKAGEKLREILGTDTKVMAYPNGDYNNEVIAVCQQAGFEMAFTTEEGRYIDIKQDNPMRLPRNCVPNSYGKWESLARALGTWQKVFKR